MSRVVCIGLLVAGCGLVSEQAPPANEPPPPSSSPPNVGSTPIPSLAPDAGPPDASTIEAGSCADLQFLPEGTSCAGESIANCTWPIAGVPCCSRTMECKHGLVAVTVSCLDSCPNGCEAVTAPFDCAVMQCDWVVPGCGAPPQGAVAPAAGCRSRRACVGNGDCPSPETCVAFWVNPCAGGRCSACGGEQRRCAPP